MSEPRLHKLGDLKAIEDRVVVGQPAVDRLRVLVDDADPEVRGPAAALSGRFPGAAGLIERVLEVSRSDDSGEVRLEALEALAGVVSAGELAGAERDDYEPEPELGEPAPAQYAAARARLAEALEATAAERAQGLLGLAPLADRLEAVAEGILRGLEGEPAERSVALRAIARHGSRRWREAIERGLADDAASVAREAALAAASVGLRELAPLVQALLEAGAAQARVGAAIALGRLAGRAGAPSLLAAAERDGDEAVRNAARQSLADLGLDE